MFLEKTYFRKKIHDSLERNKKTDEKHKKKRKKSDKTG